MPALPAPLGASTTSKMRRWPAAIAGSRSEYGLAAGARVRELVAARRGRAVPVRASPRRSHPRPPPRGRRPSSRRSAGRLASRAQTGAGSELSSAFMVSTSPISRSWRAARSISSLSMPLTSRSRSTARPPTARPSASSGRPALVVSVITKPRPSLRSVSTACCMRCAAAGSSQAPKASTRSGTEPGTTMPVSPKISGSSAARRPGHQHLRLRQQQRLEPVDFGAQRHGLVVRRAFIRRRRPCACAAARWWRAPRSRPGTSVSVRVASCWRLSRRDGADHVVDEAKGRAHAGASRRAERAAKRCKNEGGEESAPPRTRTQPLVRRPDCLRHSDLPQECERRPPRRSRIAGLYPRGDSRRKSPDRERRVPRGYFARMTDPKPVGATLFQRVGPLRHVLDADAAERRRKRALGFDQRRLHDVIGQRRVGQRRIVVLLDARRRRAGCPRR